MPSLVIALALVVLALGALFLGATAFAVLVLAVSVAALGAVSRLLARPGARPVLPVALIPGLILPAMIAGDVAGDPSAGWDRIPGAFAVAVLAGFALVLLFGRRGGAVAGLAGTATASLLVGLGASGLILLRGLPDGTTWVLAVLALLVAADGAGPLVRRLQARRDADDPDEIDLLAPAPIPLAGVLPALVAVAIVAGILVAALEPPFEPLIVALLAVVAVVAALGGGYLHRALSLEAGLRPHEAEPRVGEGLLLGVVDAAAIAAPAAYVLARSAAL
jgi:CDP-diglyceride synthetase